MDRTKVRSDPQPGGIGDTEHKRHKRRTQEAQEVGSWLYAVFLVPFVFCFVPLVFLFPILFLTTAVTGSLRIR